MRYDKTASKIALFIESYLFPGLFLFYALEKAYTIYLRRSELLVIIPKILKGTGNIDQISFFSRFNANFILFFLNILVAWGLLIRKGLRQEPKKFHEIYIPLLATFFYLSFNFVDYFPKELNLLLAPEYLFPWFPLIGSLVSLLGLVISAVATYNLRYSYAIFMEVREIVAHGLYRYVRHPIYLGYILDIIGLCIVYNCISFFVLATISIWLFVYRAIAEEKKLATFSPIYRRYMQETPFLFPLKFKNIKRSNKKR